MNHELIAQVIGAIPTLTDAQISAMNSVQIQGEAHIEADAVVGPDAGLVMAQVHESVDAGVYAVARLAVLGILSQGLIDPASSATLIRYWTDIMEPLDLASFDDSETNADIIEEDGEDASNAEKAPLEAPHAPTEEEVADLGAPVAANDGDEQSGPAEVLAHLETELPAEVQPELSEDSQPPVENVGITEGDF